MSVPEGRAAPESFGRYKDPVLLGQGGMGAVYRATDPQLDRFVAVKVLTHREPKYVERFRREAQVLAKIMHPSIIQIYEIVGSDDDGTDPYIVMEYFEGKPLDAILKMGALHQRELVGVLRQTADGLKRAHGANVIHRDIKPANIMMAANGDVKILDFGIAKALDAKKDLTGNTVLGTPYYMSPEQAMGQPIDPRTDVYSLGITAFHLLTGKRPFEAKSKVDVMLMQVKNALPDMRELVSGLDERVVGIIEKMCAKQPGARFQSCQELIDALDALPRSLGGQVPDTKSASSPGRPPSMPPPPPPMTAQERPVRVDPMPPRSPTPLSPRPSQPAPMRAGPVQAQTPGRTPRASAPGSTPARLGAQQLPRPDVRQAPPPAVPRRQKPWVPVLAGLAAGGLLVAGGFFLAQQRHEPGKGSWRVPQTGWIYPGPPAPPLKQVHSQFGYGRCIFSTRPLEPGKEDGNALRPVFASGEPIHGRCYLAHQIGPSKAGEVWQELFVDGKRVAQIIYDPPLANDDDQVGFDFGKQNASRLAELPPGKHILDVWIYRQGEDPEPEALAAGEFTVRK